MSKALINKDALRSRAGLRNSSWWSMACCRHCCRHQLQFPLSGQDRTRDRSQARRARGTPRETL